MNLFPVEILRRVVSLATITDGALDTGFSSTQEEERQKMSRLISTSMATKCSLSAVSKLFHELTEEYLFEIVCVKDHRVIRMLVDLLRQDVLGRPKRGWWCRRLGLDLRYDGESWKWGGITLWGLLPACPQLVDLRCHVEYLNEGFYSHGATDLSARFPVTETMLKLIATGLASTLRRLELTGLVTVPLAEVERLLLYLDRLESCRILGLQLPPPVSIEFENLDSHEFIMEPDETLMNDEGRPMDEEDAPMDQDEPFIAEDDLYKKERDAFMKSHILEQSMDPVMRCHDLGEREEYDLARREANWPTTPTSQNIDAGWHLPHLSCLHTLDISQFTPKISKWNLPSLAAVGAGLTYWTRTPEERADEVMKGIIDKATNIRSLTCYGVRGQGIDVWVLVASLPNVEYLQYHVPWIDLDSRLLVPLEKLRKITIYRNFYNNPGHNLLLQQLYGYWQGGLLPALKQISVTGTEVLPKHMASVLVPEFAAVGISVLSNTTEGMWIIDLV